MENRRGSEESEDELFPFRLPTARGLRGMLDEIREVAFGRGEDEDEDEDEEPNRLQEDIARLEEEQEARRQRNIGAVFITDMLNAYPVEKANSNKIILPNSIFTEIVDKKIFDNKPAGKPLIFKLEVADPETGDVIETTYAGVDEFTAPPGKVGLPHKTALSLTKERGVGWLKENPMVFLTYVNLPTHAESFMQIQPRGKGFHDENNDVVNLDIKTILENTLRDHIVLTRDDWIPIYHEGKWYELIVKDTKPDETLEVLNTDLEVDILPSEETQKEQNEINEAKEKLKEFMDTRNQRGEEKSKKLAEVKEPEKSDKSAVLVRARLPNSKAKNRRFELSSPFGLVLDWVEMEMYKSNFIPAELPQTSPDEYWFKMTEKIPRKAARNITGKDAWKTIKQVMEEGEGVKSGISLIVEVLKQDTPTTEPEKTKEQIMETESSENEWNQAFVNLQARIEAKEDEEPEEETLNAQEVKALAERLIEYGVAEANAETLASKFAKQLMQLESMGYSEQMPQAVVLLEENGGHIGTVVDRLIQGTYDAIENVNLDEDQDEEENMEEID